MENIYEYYQNQVDLAARELKSITRRINILAFSRLLVLLGGGWALFQIIQRENVWLLLLAFFLLITVFFALVFRQSKLVRIKQRWTDFMQVNENEIKMRDGAANLYDAGSVYESADHPYSDDLDIFGTHSLYAYVNRSATRMGNSYLSAWMKDADGMPEVIARQQAVKELSHQVSWCQEFQIDLFPVNEQRIDFSALLSHFLGEIALPFGKKWLKVYVKLAPWLIILGFTLGFLTTPVWSSLATMLLIGNLMFVFAGGKNTSAISYKMDRAHKMLDALAVSIAQIENRTWESSKLQELQKILFNEKNQSTSLAIKEVSKLIQRLDLRLNMLLGTVLNAFLLWDFRQIIALQDWQRNHGPAILQSLEVVGQFEALVSISTLARNHPHWCFPSITQDAPGKFKANNLAHPLIASDLVVANSYDNADHRIALITGSNMAGKSTFLRTVGVNAVLAWSGAPVCASQMEIGVMKLVSYMRIKDSLMESTSTFKAELNRMKMILQRVESDKHSFFLIDEMLRGTNSVDKYRGSKAIIERLIQENVSGLVATHDLKLASLQETYPEVIRNYHFDIKIEAGEMKFDYLLKSGECKQFNAAILLKGIGIEVN